MKLYLLSGLGADERAFEYLDLPGIEKCPVHWVPPLSHESLSEYAKRLADQIKEENVNLLGVSFGGIIAQEMSKYLSVRRLIIISSVKNPKEIGPAFKIMKFIGIGKLLGPKQIKDGMLKMGHKFFGLSVKWEKDLLRTITLDTDEVFIKWAVRQIHNWKGSNYKGTIIHIHGTKDKLFPVGRIKEYIPIKNGGHFMIVNRAKEISDILIKALQ